jgi:acetoin utilization deacetylase AcuC-like enzyme
MFLAALKGGVEQALDEARADLAIFLAGADPYSGDRLGRLSISKEGLVERDRIVLSSCWERGIPVAVTMGGGYAKREEDTVEIHFRTIERAAELPRFQKEQA